MENSPLFVLSSSDSDHSVRDGDGEEMCGENLNEVASPTSYMYTDLRVLPDVTGVTTLSMDEVLFGKEGNCSSVSSPRQHVCARKTRGDSCGSCDSVEWGKAVHRKKGGEKAELKAESLHLVSVEKPEVHGVELMRLKSMTCADVRAVLEPFFWQREEAAELFNRLPSQLQLKEEIQKGKGSVSNVVERWRRLVNISKWGDGNSSKEDVLFPEVLVPPASVLLGVSGATWPGAVPSDTRQLRPHQMDGIRFMWSILAEGPVGLVPAVGCILAHTMGLGKTCQVIIFLHLFLATRRLGRGGGRGQRVLIAVPKSMRSGWCGEFVTWSRYFPLAQRITPVVIDESDSRNRRVELYSHWWSEGGVLIVGYEMLLGLTRSVEAAAAIKKRMLQTGSRVNDACVDLLICDEAHRLKSDKLQISAALRSLHPLRRLLLTGTPLQNHLHEYWVMVDFTVHKYFEQRGFRNFFIDPIEASVDRRATSREVAAARMKTFTLIQELRHFVQRVDSSPLQKELPPLREYVVVVSLSKLQATLYRQFLRVVRLKYSNLNFLQLVTYANKISAHPQLLFTADTTSTGREILNDGSSDEQDKNSEDDNDKEDGRGGERDKNTGRKGRSNGYPELCRPPDGYIPVPEDGAKLHVAMMIIRAAVLQGEKTLLFSLSTKLLDLFLDIIAEMNLRWKQDGSMPRPITSCRLDGSCSSNEREEVLRSFASENGADVFLLSMKAGGVGITITSATRVILVDSGFNPADDRQAIGRAYRYGQMRPVFVYRLLCYQTLEHRMLKQKLAKEWLFRTVVEEASLKRDALSGLRLQSIFELLGHERSFSSGAPVVTEAQRNSTAAITLEDRVLADVAANIVYAESHEVFLQHDDLEQYGEEERFFYKEYQKKRLFNVDTTAREGNDRWHRLRKQPEEHQQDVTMQAKSLTALVDNIIRCRAEDDSTLRHLLRMMGVRVDTGGSVSVASVMEQTKSEEREGKMELKVVKNGRIDEGASSPNQKKVLRTETAPRFQAMMLDDGEDSVAVVADFSAACGSGNGGGEAGRNAPLVNPSTYEPLRPGRTARCAILIDDDDDET